MKRQRLDSIELSDIHSITDLAALARTNYAGSLRIVKLYALLAVAMQIELQLATQENNRANVIARKLAAVHVTGIKKRITQIEQVNARKASRARRDRTLLELADIVSSAGALSHITRLAPSQALPPIAPIVRAQIAAPIIADLSAPSTDESYAHLIAAMNKADDDRAAKPAHIHTEQSTNSNSSNSSQHSSPTDNAYGSPEDWITSKG